MGAIDEILATIRRLPLRDRLRLLERAANEVAEDTPRPASVAPSSKPTVDDLLGARLTPAAGIGPVSVEDMDHAIAKGALGSGASLLGLMGDEQVLLDTDILSEIPKGKSAVVAARAGKYLAAGLL
ncbi:MAG TPA: hypothetical protein VJV79_33770 [Polyangiaceae bacterium]|nr:hypothetical protein [Polyangiaceae bacterium]